MAKRNSTLKSPIKKANLLHMYDPKTMTHYSFPSIDQFSHVRRNVQWKAQYRGQDANDEPIMDRTAVMPTLCYEGTVKCHGSNGAICFEKSGGFYCQSRERIITPDNDNAGFARWAESVSEQDWNLLRANFPAGWNKVAVYGEWAGTGIQKNVAISTLPKAFYVFAARLISEDGEKEEWLDTRNWILPQGIYNIYNYPTFKIDIDFESPEYAIAEINKWVLEVEAECPIGKALLNVSAKNAVATRENNKIIYSLSVPKLIESDLNDIFLLALGDGESIEFSIETS